MPDNSKAPVMNANGNGSGMFGEDRLNTVKPNLPKGVFEKVGLSLIPFTPVTFSGSDMPYAVGRIVVYGGLSAYLWNKNKTLSYVCAGAALMSAATSITGKIW